MVDWSNCVWFFQHITSMKLIIILRGWLARSVSLDHNQQTSKTVQLATQIAQIDPRISRAIWEHNSFQKFSNWRDSDSTQPIFKFKMESVREKVHLSFPARRFFKSSVNFQKISFENGLHTYKGRFYCIFKFKGIILTCRYTILLQKAARRVFGTRLLECRKASFISATKLIVSFS